MSYQILIKLKAYIKGTPLLYVIAKRIRHPWVGFAGWLYGAYLTIRFVDKYTKFPAIIFRNNLIRVRITKALGSKLILQGRLIVSPFGYGTMGSSLLLGQEATFLIESDFEIGDDVKIVISNNAELRCGGKKKTSGSGITCQAKVLVRRRIEIGADTIISWGTFITDSDHHPVNGQLVNLDTMIGEHVWVAAGVQILKGSQIGDNSIIAAHAVVLKGDYPEKSLLAGIPAKAVGAAPEWSRD